jgi:hypothetical protein
VNTKQSDEEERKSTSDEQCIKHREKLLDLALEESFPASDPPSIARPHIRPRKGEDDC